MKRKNERLTIFTKRFRELQNQYGPSDTEFANFLGISRQSVGFYKNGKRLPDLVMLVQIAQECDVSTDWLLGISSAKSSDPDIQRICKQTGLSEDIVNFLINKPTYSHLAEYMEYEPFEALNKLFCSENLYDLLPKLSAYFNTIKTVDEICCETESIILNEKREWKGNSLSDFCKSAQDEMLKLKREYRWCHFEVIDYFTRILNEIEEQENISSKIQNIQDLCEKNMTLQ